MEQGNSQPLVIRKDGHFIRTESAVLEYSPTEGIPYADRL